MAGKFEPSRALAEHQVAALGIERDQAPLSRLVTEEFGGVARDGVAMVLVHVGERAFLRRDQSLGPAEVGQ